MTTETLTPELPGWVLALAGGATLVGKLRTETRKIDHGEGCVATVHTDILEPVFVLDVLLEEGPGGRVRAQWRVSPVAYLASFESLKLPMYVPTKPCEELDADDRRRLHGAIQGALDARRARRTGLTLPGRG